MGRSLRASDRVTRPDWIPAFAGMTNKAVAAVQDALRAFAPSRLCVNRKRRPQPTSNWEMLPLLRLPRLPPPPRLRLSPAQILARGLGQPFLAFLVALGHALRLDILRPPRP